MSPGAGVVMLFEDMVRVWPPDGVPRWPPSVRKDPGGVQIGFAYSNVPDVKDLQP